MSKRKSSKKSKKNTEEILNVKSEMFWAKIFTTKYDFVVAVCDEEILEKELNFKYDKKKDAVKVVINKNFYGGMKINEGILLRLLKKATIANFMGKRSIELAEKNGFIIHENIILIDDIPHAQFVKI